MLIAKGRREDFKRNQRGEQDERKMRRSIGEKREEERVT
jgi:hypothetical protein